MQQAYEHLFNEPLHYETEISYSGRLSDYNAHIILRGTVLEAKLSKKWRRVSPEIKMGLLQELYLRLWRKKLRQPHSTLYVDLYNSFVKNVHIAVPKTRIDQKLEASFDRVNQHYFLGLVEKPNLVWSTRSTTTRLGSYDFKRDRIVMSSVFKELVHDPALLDVVMYHEMLHKQHKYRSARGRACYHDAKFRKAEQQFEDFHAVQERLSSALRNARRTRRVAVPGIAGFIRRLF